MSAIRDAMVEQGEDEVIFLDPASQFDSCVMGIVERGGMGPVMLYDAQKVVKALMTQGLEEEKAQEFFAFNIAGSYMGERSPMFFYPIDK